MRRLVIGVAAGAVVVATTPVLAAVRTPDWRVRAGSASAVVTGSSVMLSDGLLTRRWSLAGGAVRTVALGGTAGREWAKAGPDFRLTIDGVPTSSTSGWQLTAVRPLRNADTAGVDFRYALANSALPSGVTLDRRVTLRSGRAAMQVTSTLTSAAVPLRVTSYSLDEIDARDAGGPVEVQAYNGGSDWRDDYRHVSRPTGAFDTEGEVVRSGADAGFFLVSQRRGGLMSRAGRDADGSTWVGVDWARDAFDFGPLRSDPPDYNRLANPAYPVPIRSRLVTPGETLHLGTAWTGVYAGGAEQAAAAFVDAFGFHVDDTVGANSFHPWEHGPGMSDANLRHQIDVAAALGVRRYMLDDQWQGGSGGESGDWRFDPARFPDTNHDGIPDFVTYLHGKGMQLGLWMSPLEFNPASRTYAAHPEWACAPTGDVTAQDPDDAGLGVWDATNPQFQSYLLGVIDRLVKAYDVREFKFDFMAWVDCGGHDYADYEDAFVSLVQRMEAAHPGVTFELDETNDQRAWAFESEALGPSWFDNGHDHGSGPVPKLLHDVWTAAPWLPPSTLGIGTYDSGTLSAGYSPDYLMPIALLSHLTFWTDFTKLTADQRTATRWWLSWYTAHRSGLGPFVYELTSTDPLNGKSWCVLQPWHGRSGYLFVFRQGGTDETATVRLQGLSSGTTYELRDVRTGALVERQTGAALTAGVTLRLASPHSARVLRVAPVEAS